MAYGLPIKSSNDPFVRLCQQAQATLGEAALPGAFLVNVLPALKHVPEFVPGAGFKKQARVWRKLQEDMLNVPFHETMKNIVGILLRPCNPD
jgi:hypothetical protein